MSDNDFIDLFSLVFYFKIIFIISLFYIKTNLNKKFKNKENE